MLARIPGGWTLWRAFNRCAPSGHTKQSQRDQDEVDGARADCQRQVTPLRIAEIIRGIRASLPYSVSTERALACLMVAVLSRRQNHCMNLDRTPSTDNALPRLLGAVVIPPKPSVYRHVRGTIIAVVKSMVELMMEGT